MTTRQRLSAELFYCEATMVRPQERGALSHGTDHRGKRLEEALCAGFGWAGRW